MTIALIYNVKPEAALQSSSTAGQAQHTLRNVLPVSSGPSIAAHPSPKRTNDIYAEWDTMETVNAVKQAIEERYTVELVEANEQAFQKLLRTKPDFVFNMAEGLYGVSREAQMPAMLEMLNIPYLGSNPLTLGICLDKARTKEVLAYHRIPTAQFAVVRTLGEFEDARVKFPAMVKPLHEGSSKGIYNSCVARNMEDLEREVRTILDSYNQPALIEEYLPGREFTVAILGNGEDTRILPVVEIKFDALPRGMNPIYSYEAKWIWDTTENPLNIFECPAHLDDALLQEITSLCLDAYKVLECRDWARIDVRCDAHGRPNVLEVNPLPGILPKPEDNSCFPKAARADGLSYNGLINAVLDHAMARCGVGAKQELETLV